MNWFQSLDTAIFRFINDSLSNPVFDRIMPFFSDNPYFYPVLVVALLLLVFKGGVRGRLCAFMLLLALIIGDGVICKEIKAAVARPRPFLTLPDVHLLLGKGGSGSMPSSHAANWFAATIITFIYYRRSWRFLLPIAMLVAFSRVYNGVHYPGDVLAGAILGAAYAFAIVAALDFLWRFFGRKWFPLWWKKLPSLVPPFENEGAEKFKTSVSAEQHWLRLGYVFIFVFLGVRLLYLASGKIELTEDEAYQWLWSKHPALSYYSKPPMIAYLQWLGTHLWGDTQFGVRFLSPVIAACLGFLTLRFLARNANARLGFIAVLIFTCTPLLAVGSTLMTIDPPLVLFWTAAMFAGWNAVQPNGKTRDWIFAGFFLGLSFLSKYSAFYQIICWALFFFLWKPARVHLQKPGPYLAILIFLLSFIPVLIWNAQHDWITVEHVSHNAGRNDAWRFTLNYFIDFIGSQAVILTPIFFVAMLWAAIAFWKNPNTCRDPLFLFFFSMGAPIFLGHMLFTIYKRIQPNWIAPSILPLFLLMILFWNRRWENGVRIVKTWFIAALILGGIVVVVLFDTNLITKIANKPLPAKNDPLRRARGWQETANIVNAARQKLSAEGKPVFIIGAHYGLVGELSFYIPEAKIAADAREPLVYYLSNEHPQNQIFFWPEYRYRNFRRGENAIYVQESDPENPFTAIAPLSLQKEFDSVENLGAFPVIYRDGRIFRTLQIFACRNLQ